MRWSIGRIGIETEIGVIIPSKKCIMIKIGIVA